MQSGASCSFETEFRVAKTFAEGFRNLLPNHFTYDFLEGETECPPAPGIEKVCRGPYMSYLSDYSVGSIAGQQKFIMDIVAEEGMDL